MEDSDHESTKSGALIGSNDDLLTEILLRLPASSILRFKSVSKHWQSLLSHRNFTLRFDLLLKSPGLFTPNEYVPFDVENRSTPPFRTLDFCFDRYGIKIEQSCNGLFLCSSHLCSSYACNYYVFNPTTKQFAIIPPVPVDHTYSETVIFMGLAFHRTHCVHYKVVCVVSLDPFGIWYQIQLYSSDTQKWKICIESFSPHFPLFSNGVYWNGAMHWSPSSIDHMYFKIDTEELQLLPLPAMMSPKETTMHFGESRGHMHLIKYDCTRICSYLNVYEMLNDYSGWFVKYKIEVDQHPETSMYTCGYELYVVDVIRGEKEEDTFIVVIIPGKLMMYNAHDKTFKDLFRPTVDYIRGGYLNFRRYTEALTSF